MFDRRGLGEPCVAERTVPERLLGLADPGFQ